MDNEKRELVSSGKTVDEAIFLGLTKMEISIDEVDVVIVQNESRGLLGIGAKPAIVKLVVRDDSDELKDIKNMVYNKSESKPQPEKKPDREIQKRPVVQQRRYHSEATPIKSEEKQDSEIHTEEAVKPVQVQSPQRSYERSTVRERNGEQGSNLKRTEAPTEPAVEYSKEFADKNESAQFLKGMLTRMGYESEISGAMTDSGLKLKIDADNAGVIIGKRGETLDALQYITLLVANKNLSRDDYLRVSLDMQGYREKRQEGIIRLARSKASAVRASGRPYKLEAMSSYERRIVHWALQNHPYVITRSEGREPYRAVVIIPKQNQRRQRPPVGNK